MKKFLGKLVSVGKLSGKSGEDRRFSARISPFFKARYLGLFKRKSVNFNLNLSSTKSYFNLLDRRYKGNPELIQKLRAAHKEDRHFFHQPEILSRRERFISIIGKANIEEKRFKVMVEQLALDKHIWKWGISCDIVLEIGDAAGKDIKIYKDGKLLPTEFGLIKKFYYQGLKERKNPYEAAANIIKFIPVVEKLRQTMEAMKLSAKIWGLFSDIHTANKSAMDNFGKEKEAHLIVLLNYMIKNKIPLLIAGDFFELWQSRFGHIAQAYPELFALMKQLPLVVMVQGNHDDDIIENPIITEGVKKLFTDEKTGKCNLVIVPHFVHSFENIDVMMTHGDIADPMNNNSLFGKIMANIAVPAELIFNDQTKGINNTEQVLEGLGRAKFFSDYKMAKGEVINYFTHLMSMIKLYRYTNEEFILDEVKRTLILIYGHTHELVKLVDPSSRVQSMLYQVIDQIEEIKKSIDVYYINLGGGSGENPAAEKHMRKNDHLKDRGKDLKTVQETAKRKHHSLGIPREDFTFLDVVEKKIANLSGYTKDINFEPIEKPKEAVKK